MEITERIIIEQLKRGNEEAYKYLYRHHYALLCHIAHEYVGDDFLAETLVGDVVFHLWEVHETLDIQVSLRSYLVRAVRNHCMDYLSSKKERTEVAFSSIPEEGEMRYLLSDDYPLGSLLEHELEEEIHHAIRNLPEVCRKVFIKSRFEGKKYEEIATELNISVNTVKYHIKSALSSLHSELGKYLIILILFFRLSSKKLRFSPTRSGENFVSPIETLKMEERNSHIDELIAAFLSKGLSKEAREELDAWIASSEENRRYFMQQQEIWFSAVQEEERTRYDADRAFETFRKRVAASTAQKQSKKVIGWKTIYKYAAAVLVVGLISFFSYRQGENNLQNALTQVEVEAPLGAQTRLRLPDGTLVVLNAGSRLVYPQDFGVDNREVELSGEGYFEVERNEKLPFHVQTPSLSVRVLGTKFNFRDYPNDEEAVVSLLEGKVALDNRLRAEAEMILLPNEQVTLDKAEGRMTKEAKEVKNILEWTSGKLFFDELPLPEVVKILERSYDVHITFATDSLRDFRFYGSFGRGEQSIKDILEALEKTGKVHYIQNEQEITLY